MRPVFVVGDNIYSPLGESTAENMTALHQQRTGVQVHKHFRGTADNVCAALISGTPEEPDWGEVQFTRFERMLSFSIREALEGTNIDIGNAGTMLVLSSTKGNISQLESERNAKHTLADISLATSANKIAAWLGLRTSPVVISNACISGVAALVVARRLIQAGKAEYAVVAGADEITRFIQSGFTAFQALSDDVCKPFDKERNGINLGEAAATIVLSATPPLDRDAISILGGSVSNDANHLSGPSRTGEGLALAIQKTLAEAGAQPEQIDFISAHGTATLYNDAMEAKAIHLTGLQHAHVNSLKGYFGHTLGAAGLVESVVTLRSMAENIILPTYGFKHPDPVVQLKVSQKIQHTEVRQALKTASGFGGCNAAILFSKSATK